MNRYRFLSSLLLLLALALPAFAQVATPIAELEALLEKAPSRHPSQPGAKVIDAWIENTFTEAAARNNDPKRHAQAKALIKKVEAANQTIFTAYRELALPSDRDETTREVALNEAARNAYRADLDAAKALDGLWHSGQMTFPSALYVPGKATITTDGKTTRLYQVAPNLVDPGNLPAEGFSGSLVYVGRATPAELSGINLSGAAVLVEFASSNRWIDAVQLGAKMIIIIEPKNANFLEAQQKSTVTPLRVPRFYIKRDDLNNLYGQDWKDALSAEPQISIAQEPGVWKNHKGTIDWLFIPGSASPQPGKPIHQDPARQLVHLQAYRDADSFVPELTPGATSASNLVLLMRLLKHYEKEPPLRPTVLSVVDMHCNALLGEMEFASAAFGLPKSLQAEITKLQTDLGTGQFVADLYRQPIDAELVASFRGGTQRVAGQTVKLNKAALDSIRGINNDLRQQRDRQHTLRRTAAQHNADVAAFDDKIKEIDNEIEAMQPFMRLFNHIGRSTDFADLTGEQRQWLQDIFSDIADKATLASQTLLDRRQQQYDNLALRRRLMLITNPDAASFDVEAASPSDIFIQRHAALDATAFVALDLTFGTDAMGFFPYGEMTADREVVKGALKRVQRMARFTLRAAEELAASMNITSPVVDTIRNVGGVAMPAYLGGAFAMGSMPAHLHDRSGLTLTGIRDSRPQTYTPHDTTDRINHSNFDRIMGFTEAYLPRLLNNPKLGDTRQNLNKPDSIIFEIDVRMQDQFSVNVPQTPMDHGLLVVQWDSPPDMRSQRRVGNVNPNPMWMTDARGTVVMRSAVYRRSSLIALRFNADYRSVNAVLDLGIESRFTSSITEAKSSDIFLDKMIVCFEATKIDLVGATEPVNLMPIGSLTLLDGKQDTTPRQFFTLGVNEKTASKEIPLSLDGTASIFIDPLVTYKVIAGLSLVINATEENRDGIGFTTESKVLPDLVSLSATDMWRLTDKRLDLLESKGVVNETARAFNDAAGEEVEKTLAARDAAAYDEALIHAEKARGLAYWSYIRTTGSMNDLIKAAVIFLALVIPFCFFLMKLITPYTDVNRQLALFALVFVVMALLLWMVHPAFKVAKTPAVVVLAFIIFGLASFVATVLMGRFNSAMSAALEQSQMSESVDAPQGRLAGVAFMVGVNNMKRRRIRTALTCATIVLVTFTMLSVISVGQDVEPAQVKLAKPAPYNGFVYTRPGLGAMSVTQVRRLRAHYRDKATVIARSWCYETGTFGEYLPFHINVEGNTEDDLPHLESKVLVGLEMAERDFLGPMPLVGNSRWFSSNDAEEMVLSVSAAALLGLTPENFRGTMLTVRGRTCELVGLVDDERIAEMEDLGELPLLPLLQEASQSASEQSQQAGASKSALEAETSGSADLAGGGDMLSQPGVEEARPIDVALVPPGFSESLGQTNYHMLCVKYAPTGDETEADAAFAAWQSANELIRFQFARLFVGVTEELSFDEGTKRISADQYALASSSSTQVGGILKVAIPIILAATIIFNTMLGAVMERKKEVSIYNAIGLNPGHVMMFFLAESMVFGLVGSVAGYLIGQILSLLITHFDLIELNLNYSSMSVMVVIFLTISTVLLSTIYPAMMAARAAVPSGQRRWSLPQPEGDEIHVAFPFSYDATRVLGVCAYLREYMTQHSEASTGNFLANPGPVGRVPDREPATEDDGLDNKSLCMVFDIAPAPFDLGVNQKVEIYAYYNRRVKAHMLSVHLTRISGEMNNWVTVNQPFLEALRKRLLGWRSQKDEIHETFYRKGEQLFKNAPDLPVKEED